MLPPGTTEAENDPVYQAGMLIAQARGIVDDVLKGKVEKKEIVPSLNAVRDALLLVLNLLKEAD